MRAPLGIIVALITITLGAIASGCGAKFPLPTEVLVAAGIPGDLTYQRIATWYGMEHISDMVLIPGPQLFLVFRAAGGQPARVVEYKTTAPEPLATSFQGTINPNALCVGANRLFVLDQGDTAAARTNFPCVYTADCGPLTKGFSRPIVNLAKYWHVNEYLLDGTPSSAFTDTSLAWVNGIAADDQGGVYVSGVLIVCVVNPFDSRIRTLDSQFGVRRYVRGAGGSYVIGPWHRDTGYEIVEGTGIGSTKDPRGLFWANHGGSSLYFADRGNNEAQKFDPASLLNSFKLDVGGAGADSLPLRQPLDVTADRAGYAYVCDTGNDRVLRYDPEGGYVQRVDIEPDLHGSFLVRPVAVAADTNQVYVADSLSGVIARFRRRQ
jgi:hypothetical protein